MAKIKVAVIGIGGFGSSHLNSLKYCAVQDLTSLEAAVVRNQPSYKAQVDLLKRRGVRIYPNCEDMLTYEGKKIDLVTLPTSIDSHAELTITCLKAGKHVLCEKPAACSWTECLKMEKTMRQTGKVLAI
ncbi:MAG TPA: Gfo/Idh/MocA family oxidoreductase, partial [Spirochaetota bacterium]|nr:Gfo/Idh/MocA family oxidoreductase [Spirochaetota bacterium]